MKIPEEQSADPITSQGYKIEFCRRQIAVGESFDVYIEGLDGTQIVRP